MFTPELEFLSRYTDLLRTRLARATSTPDDELAVDDGDAVGEAEVIALADRATERLIDTIDETLPAAELRDAIGLDATEIDILLFAAAPRLDPILCAQLAAVCAPLPIDWACPFAWLRIRAVDEYENFWVDQYRFLDESPLFRAGLIELVPRPGFEAVDRLRYELYVPDDIVAMLRGERTLDARTEGLITRDDGRSLTPRPAVPDIYLDRIREVVDGYTQRRALPAPPPPSLRADLVAILGGRGVGKTQAVLHVAQRLGMACLVLDGQALAVQPPMRIQSCIEHALRQAARHFEILLIDRADTLLAVNSAAPATLMAAAARHRALVFVVARGADNFDPLLRDSISVRLALPPPSFETSTESWSIALDEWGFSGLDPRKIAARYPLDGRQIQNAARYASLYLGGASDGPPGELPHDLQQGALAASAMTQLDDNMGKLGIADSGNARLVDLILPKDIRVQINEIISAFQHWHTLYNDWGFGARIHRGRGLICLFDGDPGTGKTMCAEVLSNELELKLVRVNTGQVIDKYIGETEKRLGEIFDRAHPGMNLLLFDEADSLFGKRTKVERSTDRYANAAINVLLQLVEHYEGLVVLTTNLKQGIDPAFERRFTYKVRFEVPGPKQRAKIWRRFIPDEAPVEDEIDFKYLGKEIELTGGGIKTAVIRAAYLALKAGDSLSMEHLLEAGYRELAAAGKLVRQRT